MAGTDSEVAFDPQSAFDRVTDKTETTQATPEPVIETQTETAEQARARDERGRFARQEEERQTQAAETEQRGNIPPARLREEAEARRRVEAERDELKRGREEQDRRFADMERRLEQMSRPRAEPLKPVEVPDVIENPQGFAGHVTGQVERLVQRRIIDMSFADAHDAHGKAFEDAFSSLQKAVGEGDTSLRDRIVNAPNPGKALMRWHNERRVVTELGGTDLESYRKKISDEARAAALADPEFRKAAMEAWRAEAGQNSRPSNVTDLPSLNRATGSGADASESSDSDPSQVFRKITSRKR